MNSATPLPQSQSLDAVTTVTALAISVGLFGLWVVSSPQFWENLSDAPTAPRIGDLTPERGRVRLRRGESIFWHDLTPRARALHDGDTIHTGPDGEASVQLDGSSLVQVKSNSLLVFRVPPKPKSLGLWSQPPPPPSLEVKEGRLSLKSGGALKLVAKGREFQIAPAKITTNTAASAEPELEIDTSGAGGAIAFRGDAKSMGVQERAGDGKLVTLTLAPLGPKPLTPTENEEYFVPQGAQKSVIKLSWTPRGAAGPISIEVVTAGGGEQRFEIPAGTNEKSMELAAGTYRWRARAGEADSGWMNFKISRVSSPVTTGPTDAALLLAETAGAKSTVRFLWETLPDGTRAELELTPAGSAPQKHAAGVTGFSLELGEGSYSWKIRADAKGTLSEWTVLKKFTVTADKNKVDSAISSSLKTTATPKPAGNTLLPAPVPREKSATTTFHPDHVVSLEWEQVAQAYSYQLQISEDAAFRKIVIDSWMIRNKGEVRLKKEGNYYWRVRTASEAGEVGLWSASRGIVVRQ